MAASEADGSAATQTTASFREAFRAFRRRDRPLHLIHPASVLDPRPPVGPPSDTPDGAGESTTREDRSSRQQGRRSRNRDRHRSHRPTPAATEADPSRDCVYPAQLVPVSLPSDASSLPASHPTDTSSHDLTPASPLLNPRALWDVHSVEGVPGLLWVRGALAPGAAATLAEGCLHTWAGAENRSNLDAHEPHARDTGALWPRAQAGETAAMTLLPRLRWITLGYHYDWTRKVYARRDYTPFPDTLATCCTALAAGLGLGDYEAQAGIINYYATSHTLCGHTDHSEHVPGAPLFSLSLGLPAIFLVGGPSLYDRPAALRLGGGDILVMTGPARQAYHGVPRILTPEEDAEAFGSRHEAALDYGTTGAYLAHHRININVRQVVSASHGWPPEEPQ